MARGFRGVRNDLAELARFLIDAACFLGPLLPPSAAIDSPPPSPSHHHHHHRIHRRKFKSALSTLSAGSRSPSPRGGGAGPGEEMIEFAKEIVERPESWLELSALPDSGFLMTTPQREHVEAMEHLVPSLSMLKMSLCPTRLSEEMFWKIYFVLLHPKLDKYEAEFLSTHEIVESLHGTQLVLNSSDGHSGREMAVMSGEGGNNPADDDYSQVAQAVTNSEYQETTDQHLRTPSDTDAFIMSRTLFRSDDDLLFSDREEGTSIIAHKKNAVHRIPSYSSDNWVQLRNREDYSTDTRQSTRATMDKDSSDWNEVEDSDFEIVSN